MHSLPSPPSLVLFTINLTVILRQVFLVLVFITKRFVSSAKRTGKLRYLSEKKKLMSKHKEILRDLNDKNKFEGAWRLYKLSFPFDKDLPARIFLDVSDGLLEKIAKVLEFPAEFMEHDEKPLPIDIRLLGALAEKCRAFAKALHHKEMQKLIKKRCS